MDEQYLVRIYADLMGTSESSARGVLMYVVPEGASTIERKPFEERQSFQNASGDEQCSIQRRLVTGFPKMPATRVSGDVVVKGNFGPTLSNGCGACI
jgi:hypothetical protein